MSDLYMDAMKPCPRCGGERWAGAPHVCSTERKNNFLWNIHTTIVDKTIKPGTLEDKRFLSLALCGEVGELANLVKKQWRGDNDPQFRNKVEEETGDVYAYMQLLACAYDIEFKNDGTICYRLVGGTSLENMRFDALTLCVQAGKIAEWVELEWLGMSDGHLSDRLGFTMRDFYVQLQAFARTIERDLDEIMERIILPKINARWGAGAPAD